MFGEIDGVISTQEQSMVQDKDCMMEEALAEYTKLEKALKQFFQSQGSSNVTFEKNVQFTGNLFVIVDNVETIDFHINERIVKTGGDSVDYESNTWQTEIQHGVLHGSAGVLHGSTDIASLNNSEKQTVLEKDKADVSDLHLQPDNGSLSLSSSDIKIKKRKSSNGDDELHPQLNDGSQPSLSLVTRKKKRKGSKSSLKGKKKQKTKSKRKKSKLDEPKEEISSADAPAEPTIPEASSAAVEPVVDETFSKPEDGGNATNDYFDDEFDHTFLLTETEIKNKLDSIRKNREKNSVWVHLSRDQDGGYRCKLCDQTFTYKKNYSTNFFWVHLKAKHPKEMEALPKPTPSKTKEKSGVWTYLYKEPDGKQFGCKLCEQKFTQKSNGTTYFFWRHLKAKHPLEMENLIDVLYGELY